MRCAPCSRRASLSAVKTLSAYIFCASLLGCSYPDEELPVDNDDQRLNRIEQRLPAIEQQLNIAATQTPAASASPLPAWVGSTSSDRSAVDSSAATKTRTGTSTATLMALGAAGSFLLAGGYFVMLVYEAGWLTPLRQA